MIMRKLKSYKTCLGKNVYASFDGYRYILTTEIGLKTDPSNEIYLEVESIKKLNEFVNCVNKKGLIKNV